jgi:hypothetical protein
MVDTRPNSPIQSRTPLRVSNPMPSLPGWTRDWQQLGRDLGLTGDSLTASDLLRLFHQADASSRDWDRLWFEDSLFVLCDPEGAILRGTDEGLEIAPYKAAWSGPSGPPLPLFSPTIVLSWADLAGHRDSALIQLRPAVRAAKRERRRTFKRCGRCQRKLPPEHLHRNESMTVCQSCASKELGVVY